MGCLAALAALALCLSLPCEGKDTSDFARGCELRAKGKTQEATEAFRLVLAKSPTHVGALVHLGASLEDLGKWKEAEKTYLRIMEIEPDNKAARRNLDQLRAIREMDSSIPIQNRSREILLGRGLAALETKDFDMARRHFRVVRGLSPNDPRPMFYSALAWERQGDLQKAEAVYRNMTEQFPDYAPARINLILVLLARGDNSRAAIEARAGLERVRDDKRISYLARLAEERAKMSSR